MTFFIVSLVIIEIILGILIVKIIIQKDYEVRKETLKLKNDGYSTIESIKFLRFAVKNFNTEIEKTIYTRKLSGVEVGEFVLIVIRDIFKILKASKSFSGGFMISAILLKIMKEKHNLAATFR